MANLKFYVKEKEFCKVSLNIIEDFGANFLVPFPLFCSITFRKKSSTQLGAQVPSIKDDDEVIEYSTDPELIAEKYDHLVDIVIDSGYGDNVASTIVDLTSGEPEILREGKGIL